MPEEKKEPKRRLFRRKPAPAPESPFIHEPEPLVEREPEPLAKPEPEPVPPPPSAPAVRRISELAAGTSFRVKGIGYIMRQPQAGKVTRLVEYTDAKGARQVNYTQEIALSPDTVID